MAKALWRARHSLNSIGETIYMFDFIRKTPLWNAWDDGLDKQIGARKDFHLKSIQDIAVYNMLKDMSGQRIAEIGGGNSSLLAKLSKNNNCYNVEKFEGAGNGPKKEVVIKRVTNVSVFLGEQSETLKTDFFDVVFSISVVEHVPTPSLQAFLEDGVRILKPGGLWLHAIDMYVTDNPEPPREKLFGIYRDWLDHPQLEPVGPVYDGPLKFSCDMATNPDNIMYQWGQSAPSLDPLRQRAQSVSIILAARKKAPSAE